MIVQTSYHESLTKCEFRSEPTVIRVNKFDEDAAKAFSDGISAACASDQPVIPVIIDSYGGSADGVISMISCMESATKPVATICIGKAMSAGAILLAFGTPNYRFADKHSRIMIHEVAASAWGKVTEQLADVNESKRLNDYIYNLMAVRCGKDPTYFLNQMKERNNADWFLTAADAQSHGVVDHVRVPQMVRRVKVEHEFR